MSAENPTRTKLTQSVVDSAQYTSTGQRSVFDTKTPGFFLRIGKRTKTFTLQRDFRSDAKRVTVRRALGRADGDEAITVAAARDEATKYILKLKDGIDPKEEKKRKKIEEKKERERGITLAEAWKL